MLGSNFDWKSDDDGNREREDALKAIGRKLLHLGMFLLMVS